MAHTIFITRDSDAFGNLSNSVDVWTTKPIRARLTIDKGYVWLPADADGVHRGRNAAELGHVRNLSLRYAIERYGTIPDDDYQVIRCLVREA